MQRCLTEVGNISDTAAAASAAAAGNASNVVSEEIDAILENLFVARRDLMGPQLLDTNIDDGTSSSDEENTDDMHEKSGVNYAQLISSQASTSTTAHDGLAKQLQKEYTSLRNHWRTVLNKLHSNLTLHSGMSVNHSKFQSKAVDVSFWEQIQSGMDHERFQHQSTNSREMKSDHVRYTQFDDSKLYQQMLKDFISSSKGAGVTSSGGLLDPAQEAAERLKRAMRKKSGGNGDSDLTSLLTEEEEYAATKKKAAAASVATAASVDRRASKGRKIRYTVHPKLVNFTFPVSRPEPMIPNDIWFKSLFGGVGNFR